MKLIRFDSLDSLFFRDGRPYNQGELSQTGVSSAFPPSPPTLIGAIRAACARALGCRFGAWSEEVKTHLGNGPDLGPLQFRGPFILYENEPVFPVPAHMLGKTVKSRKGNGKISIEPESLHLLSPEGVPELKCDLCSLASFPFAEGVTQGAKPLGKQGWWIMGPGLKRLLQGQTPQPNHLVHSETLWQREPRVGISRSQETRTTEDGALYSSSHVRLNRAVNLAMEVSGLPETSLSYLKKGLHPVGGESRSCWISVEDRGLKVPNVLPSPKRKLLYTASILTPADTEAPPKLGEERFMGLPGRIVSACLPRPVVIGGWDSIDRKPLPLRPHLAPGSVLFIEAETEEIDQIKNMQGGAIGKRTTWGFGLIAIGNWPGLIKP